MSDKQRARMLELIAESFQESVRAIESLRSSAPTVLVDMAETIARAFRSGRRLFLFGNGGSAADAQHIAAEFVNRMQRERPSLPAIALTVDTSVITSIGNDYSFEEIFVRQLKALAGPGDLALGISTSGRSPNVLTALRWAGENGLGTLGFCGPSGTEMDRRCDLILNVPSRRVSLVQECHITCGHIVCALVEEIIFFFSEKPE